MDVPYFQAHDIENSGEWVILYICSLMDIVRVVSKLELVKATTAFTAFEDIRAREARLMPQFRRVW